MIKNTAIEILKEVGMRIPGVLIVGGKILLAVLIIVLIVVATLWVERMLTMLKKVLLARRGNKSFGFELGHVTTFVASVQGATESPEYIETLNSDISLSCNALELPFPSSIKPLIGQKFSNLELQLPNYLFGYEVSEGLDGFPIFHDKNNKTITVPELISISLSCSYKLLHLHKNERRMWYRDSCGIGIPVYFTDSQRMIVLDAAKKAGFHNPTLFHETTASAFAYAIKETRSFNKEKTYLIVDMGVTSMQVCVAEFTHNLKVLSQAFEFSLGGRAFSEVLHNHFMGELGGSDMIKDADFRWKLYNACDKMKIELSSCEEASFEIRWDDRKIIWSMRRKQFERMCVPLLERVKRLLKKALNDAGLCAENIDFAKNVGFATQIPAVTKMLTHFLGRQPNQAFRKKVRVARGCALLATHQKQVEDIFPYSIAMSWNKKIVTIESRSIIFPKCSPMNTTKEVRFSGHATFSIDFEYGDIDDLKIPIEIGRFEIGPFQSSTREKVSGQFNVTLDRNGIIGVGSASILENGKKVQLKVLRINESQELLEDMLEAKTTNEEANRELTNEMESLNIPKETSEANDDGYEDCVDDEEDEDDE